MTKKPKNAAAPGFYQASQLAEKDVGHSTQGFGYEKPLVKQTMHQAKQLFLPDTGHERRGNKSSPSGSSPGDDPPNGPDSESEMLLQPETKPISQE